MLENSGLMFNVEKFVSYIGDIADIDDCNFRYHYFVIEVLMMAVCYRGF